MCCAIRMDGADARACAPWVRQSADGLRRLIWRQFASGRLDDDQATLALLALGVRGRRVQGSALSNWVADHEPARHQLEISLDGRLQRAGHSHLLARTAGSPVRISTSSLPLRGVRLGPQPSPEPRRCHTARRAAKIA